MVTGPESRIAQSNCWVTTNVVDITVTVVGGTITAVIATIDTVSHLLLSDVQGLRAELRTAAADKKDHQKLQLSYSQLQDSHTQLQSQRSALEESHCTLQSEHSALEESYEDLRWRYSERTGSVLKAKEMAAAQMEKVDRDHALQLEVKFLLTFDCLQLMTDSAQMLKINVAFLRA